MSVTAVNLSTRHFSPFANNNCRPAGRLAFFSVDVLPPTRYYMYVPAIVILRLFLRYLARYW